MHNVFSLSGMADWLSTWGYLGLFICVFIGNLGIPVHEEIITGRKDVQPAFLRAVSYSEKQFGLKPVFPAGRDAEKRLQWTSEAPAMKAKKEKTSKVSTEILNKGIKDAQGPNLTVNRQTPKH